MKFNRLGAFTLGVVITAVSVGAVSFVNAAGDKTLKACANKTTGVMRYISKGSCKKTETSLSWNQMGPQGLTGASGTNGTNGETGVKGDAGISGSNGQNFYVVDADGKSLGRFVTTSINESYGILVDNRLWAADPTVFGFYGVPDSIRYYSDALCQNRLFINDVSGSNLSHQWVGIEHNTEQFPAGQLQKAFVRLDNTKWAKSSFSSIYDSGFGKGCKIATGLSDGTSFYKTVEIPMLTYTAPLTIVAK
jgi:hypothetical protein